MSFLVIGGDGLLGGELCRHWRSLGREVNFTTLQTFDLSGDVEAWTPPAGASVALIFAAIPDQEKCRREPEATRRINVEQTIKLARRLAELGCFVVFPSTNLVFDGSAPRPRPEDPVSPATAYARQKSDAEEGLLELGENIAIVRLTKVVHERLPLLVKWREALSRGEMIRPFNNYICSPISLAYTILGIAAVAEARARGIWHLSAADELPYSGLAELLARRHGFASSLIQPSPAPPGALEHLPRHATLDMSGTATALGLSIPMASQALD